MFLFLTLTATQSDLPRGLQAGISALKAPVLTASARKEDPLALKVLHCHVSTCCVVVAWHSSGPSNYHIAQQKHVL